MKAAPVLRALRNCSDIRQALVHTGQHYDTAMSDVFFQQLEMPEPDCNLGVGSGTHAQQTAAVMQAFEPCCKSANRILFSSTAMSTRPLPPLWCAPNSACAWDTSRLAFAPAIAACPKKSTAFSPINSPIFCSLRRQTVTR